MRFATTPLLWVMLLPSLTAAAVPATGPGTAPATTGPASAPAVELLDEGRVRIVPPPGWVVGGRGNDGLSLRLKAADGRGVMTAIVNPQTGSLSRDAIAKMPKVVGQQLREVARNEGAQFLIPPRVEPDERFLLKVRDRTRGVDGRVRDQLQIYRAMQLELVHVAIVATVETEAESRPIFEAGERMLDEAKLGTGPKPSSFRKTRVRLTIPTDWVERRTDDPNGVVATYTNPAMPGARLVVRAKIVPRAAKENPDVLAKTIDLLMDAHRADALPEGATATGDAPREPDPRFLRRAARSLTWNEQPWGTDFRCLVVGDVVIGVEALSPPQDQTVSRLADELAASIKPLDDKPGAGPKPPQRQQSKEPPRKPEDRPRLPPPQTPGIPGIPGLGI